MDPFNLARFRDAQEGVYETALAELRRGAKRSHWMWFVFPQLRGLGASSTSQFYGVSGLAEAAAYLADPLLGSRLRESFEALLGHEGVTARAILGGVDEMKLRSCATLFAALPDAPPLFAAALQRFFAGQPDAETLRRLG